MRRFALIPVVVALTLSVTPGATAQDRPAPRGPEHTFAFIADTPYGPDQLVTFPALVEAINADPDVRVVVHAGDIKNGSSLCSDELFATTKALYETFEDPFVITPGDNEWTDCHRVAAGQYVPTERLDAFRALFYPEPGRTLGQRPMKVRTQGRDDEHAAYVENVRWRDKRVVFATVHVVGSNNDLDPWAQLPAGDQPEVRLAEYQARLAAALAWIDETFDEAERRNAPGVWLMMQAEPLDSPGFAEIRAQIVERAGAYGRPVILAHGDEHVYEVEPAYAGVANLTRLEAPGAVADQWVRVVVSPRSSEVFTWTIETV